MDTPDIKQLSHMNMNFYINLKSLMNGKVTYFGIRFIPSLLGSNPSGNQVVLDGAGQGEVVVPGSGNIPVFHLESNKFCSFSFSQT